MRTEDLTLLQNLRIFSGVPSETVADLLHAGYFQLIPAGVTLLQERERADFLHVLVEGLVELYATIEDAETTMELVRPVGLFILAAVLTDNLYLQSARTLTRSRVLLIPAERVRYWMAEDRALTLAIMKELALLYRQAIRGQKNQKLRTGSERLANWLVEAEAAQGGHGQVDLDVEKRVLASLIGMTPENLSRAFSALAPVGVKSQGRRIKIADVGALRLFARATAPEDRPEPMTAT